MTGKVAKGVATKLDNALAKLAIKHPALVATIKGATKLGISSAGEATEEGLQVIFEPLFKSWAANEAYLAPDFEEVAYNALLGMLSAYALEGPSTVVSSAAEYKASKEFGKSLVEKEQVGKLKELGKTMSADTAAYQLADLIDENTNAYAIAEYFKQVGAGLSEQNVADIARGLERRGYRAQDAKVVAEYINRAINGEKLSWAQQDAIYDDEVAADVMREVFFNDKHTVNARNAEYEAIGVKADIDTESPTDIEAAQTAPEDKAISRVKYSIKYDVHNAPYVEVAKDVLANVPKKDWISTIKKHIPTISSVQVGNSDIKINRRSQNEYLYSEYTKDLAKTNTTVFKDKLNLIQNINEVIEATRNYVNEGLNHPRKDNITQFARGNTNLRIGTNEYRAEVVIGYTNGGNMLLYDVVNITPSVIYKKSRRTNKENEQNAESLKRGTSDTTIIPQPYQVVNSGGNATITDFSKQYGEQAQAFVKTYELGGKDQDAATFAAQYDMVYEYGREGVKPEYVNSERVRSLTPALSEAQRELAYSAGKDVYDAKHSTEVKTAQRAVGEAVAKAKEKPAAKAQVGRVSRVHIGKGVSAVTNVQKQSLKAIEKIAEALGVDIYVYDSAKPQNADEKNSDGWYDEATNSMHIDIRAGKGGVGTMVYTVSHELTHFIKRWSPEKYDTLASFLIEQYGEKGVSVDELIDAQIEKAEAVGDTISRDEAFDEVIADSCERMLLDSNAMQKLAEFAARGEAEQSIVKKIKDYFRKLLNKLRAVYRGLDASSAEARLVSEMTEAAEKLHALFEDALTDAAEASRAVSEAEAEVDGDVKHSRKNADYSEKYVDKYTQKQYNEFGWARDTGAITKNELDDMHSKIHVKGSLKKFPQSSYGEAIIELNDRPHTTLGANNVIAFVTGTKNEPKITRVVRINLFDEGSLDIIRKDIYEYTDHRALEAYASRMGEDVLRYYDRDHYADYRTYTEKSRSQRSGSEGEGNTSANRVWNQRSGTDQKAQEIDSRRIKSRKNPDDISPRAIPTDAMDSIAKNPDERARLAEYKAEITKLEGMEDRLYEVNKSRVGLCLARL